MTARRRKQIMAIMAKDCIFFKKHWPWELFVACIPIAATWVVCNGISMMGLKINEFKNVLSGISAYANVSAGTSRIETENFPEKCFFTPNSSRILNLLDHINENHEKPEFVYAENEASMVKMRQEVHENVSGLVFDSSKPELNFTVRITAPEDRRIKQWDEFISFHWAITSFDLDNSSHMKPYLNQPPYYDAMDSKKAAALNPDMFQTILIVNLLSKSNILLYVEASASIVIEMEDGLKELLRMMGVADCTYWFAKFINYLPIFVSQVLITTVIIYDEYLDTSLENVPFLLFMIMVLVMFISNLLIAFIITALLNRSNLVSMILSTYFAFPFSLFLGDSNLIKMFIFPSDLFGLWLSKYTTEKPSLLHSIAPFLIIPFWIIYILILLYIDGVCPWQKGTVRPLYFPCKISGEKIDPQTIDFKMDCDPKLVEDTPGEANIICSKVSKKFQSFRTAEKIAVNNVSVKVMKNSITVLLGHNGAGKTTLMNMITGFTSPTSGVIYVNGYNNQTDMESARESLALCPQHDCFYHQLTVKEHFRFFANVGDANPEIITKTIRFLNLEEKSGTWAMDLSGGMRRRLQLGMALVTDADTLILDEPTSGLDPETRRTVWDYLISLREEKTILITTHFMEEAEALADQIIIMSSGRIKCVGSPMFLKTRLGAGYSIRMGKKSFNHDATVSLMAQFYPQAVVTSDTGEEIIFNIPIDDQTGKDASFLDNIAKFCDTLDEKKKELGIHFYTITASTLEDVFMKIAVNEGRVEEDKVTFAQVKDTTISELRETLDYDQKRSFSKSFCSTYWGLLIKRWHNLGRYRFHMVSSLGYPILYLLVFPGNNLIPKGASYDFPNNIISPNLNFNQPSIILSVSSNSTLRKCFSDINNQYSVKMIIINETIDEYLMKYGSDSAYLFAIQDQGSVEDIILFGSGYIFSKAIVVNNYLNILRCMGTGEKTLIQSREHEFPKPISYDEYLVKSAQGHGDFLKTLVIPITYIFGSMYIFPGMESEKKADLIQRMSGSGDVSFLLSNMTIDSIYYTFVSAILMIVFSVRANDVLWFPNVYVAGFILLTISCFAELPLIYLLSLLRWDSLTGYGFVSGISLLFAYLGLGIDQMGLRNTPVEMRSILEKVMLFFGSTPSALVMIGIGAVLRVSVIEHTCDSMKNMFEQEFEKKEGKFNANIKKFCLDGVKPNYLEIIWPDIRYLLIFGTFFFIIVILISKNVRELAGRLPRFWNLFVPRPKAPNESGDEDVLKEKERVNMIVKNKAFSEEALIAHKLTKDFYYCSFTNCQCNSLRAVHDVSLAVHEKECFGLLGVNGAGKTTIFSMLTGEEPMSNGHAYIGKLEVSKDLKKYWKNTSYCPQQDALMDMLTPEETLTLFARLRGIPEKDIAKNIDFIMTQTDLKEYRKTFNCNLSGGNKRKLGLAIATVGGPTVMFLDEPTTGVDPASRRKIWATLIGLRESGRSSIIMTSHSMDECEALCNRIAIMAKGQIRCLGPSTHLKSKYGQGFTLIIKLKDESAVPTVKEYVKNLFSSAKLQDQHGATIQFHLPDPSLRWGDMFRWMKQVKEKLPVDNFYIHDTSIEQIFLSFAHEESSQNQ